MITRDFYLNKIQPYLGKPVIKAITGLRRVGKSVFIRQLILFLKKKGIPAKNIIYIDKESLQYDFIRNYTDLNSYVEQQSHDISGKIYTFIDEVQDIEEWERAVSSWSGMQDRYDIILTGSNSTMFSGELASKLTGRYIEFPVYPLSLREFQQFYPEISDTDRLLDFYLKFGGMPGLRMLDKLSVDTAYQFLSSIHDSIVLKDIVKRRGIRNASVLDSICKFCYDNIGNPITATSIAGYLKNQKVNSNVQSVINYMDGLEDAELFFSAPRYDIRGKKILEVNSKLFSVDLGLRHAKIGYRAGDISQLIENIVYLELRRRYDKVFIGAIGNYEVDFVAESNSGPRYYQVTTSCNSAATLKRETRSLLAIKDNYPKTIISLEKIYGDNYSGIKFASLLDFLLKSSDVQ